MNMKKCNHELNSSETTLEEINFHTMVYPQKYYTHCTVCGETFEFIKVDGHFEKVSKEVRTDADESTE